MIKLVGNKTALNIMNRKITMLMNKKFKEAERNLKRSE